MARGSGGLRMRRCAGVILRDGKEFSPEGFEQVVDVLFNRLNVPYTAEAGPYTTSTWWMFDIGSAAMILES